MIVICLVRKYNPLDFNGSIRHQPVFGVFTEEKFMHPSMKIARAQITLLKTLVTGHNSILKVYKFHYIFNV